GVTNGMPCVNPDFNNRAKGCIPISAAASTRFASKATAAMPAISRSSLSASARIIGWFSHRERQRPLRAARVGDECLFAIKSPYVEAQRPSGSAGGRLLESVVGDHEFAARAGLPLAE